MKWKDSGETNDPAKKNNKEDFFDEEQYSPWSLRRIPTSSGRINQSNVVLGLIVFAVVTSSAALLMLLFGRGQGEATDTWQLNLLQERVIQLEDRLSKYDAIDEKVSRIWEHAGSYEKFKDRSERGQASLSLRMDNIAADLEKLQKHIGEKAQVQPRLPAFTPIRKSASASYHTVAAGDTLYSISKRYQIDLDHLLELNELEKGSVLKIGQKLVVNAGSIQ